MWAAGIRFDYFSRRISLMIFGCQLNLSLEIKNGIPKHNGNHKTQLIIQFYLRRKIQNIYAIKQVEMVQEVYECTLLCGARKQFTFCKTNQSTNIQKVNLQGRLK